MTPKTIFVLFLGTLAMMIPILIIMKVYRIKLWKGVPVAFILTVTGTLGTYIWFFVENLFFGGRSYYGAVFLVPLFFIPIAKLFRVPYLELLDTCAPAECVMLVLMKYQCLVDGCCRGRELYIDANGIPVCFPSQLVETGAALLIFGALMALALNKKNRGTIYTWYLIIYGGVRFVLNIFREEWVTTEMIMPFGNIWSLVSIAIGVLWLLWIRKHKQADALLSDHESAPDSANP